MKKLKRDTVTCLEDLRFWMSSIVVHYRRFEWLEGCVGDAGGNPERNLIWHSLITRMVKTIIMIIIIYYYIHP
jgi:hypothetical protein